MLSKAQVIAIYWWFRRRQRVLSTRRFYIRPAHQIQLVNSFRLFQRYYESDDLRDLENFCRLSPENFNNLYALIEDTIGHHQITHRRPITGKQRLVIFLR